MRPVGLDDRRALDAIPVEGDRDDGTRRIASSDTLHLLERLARKGVADVRAAISRNRAAHCGLVEAGPLHMLGRQHRDVLVDGIGEPA
jgi:hypothetical protein